MAYLIAAAQPETPLIVLAGPTASGKTALAITMAERFAGEIISCDSVAVYRHMEIGTAKPSVEERARVPHHLIDVADPADHFTAGDYSRLARLALADIRSRNRLPIVAGGTGLYLRALLEGLSPAPTRNEELRERLRSRVQTRGVSYLHKILSRLDLKASKAIHANDLPKVIRAIEASLTAHSPLTEQWQQGRDRLTGYRTLLLGLAPPREQLYTRINQRAAAMFTTGLVEETAELIAHDGEDIRALNSLGYTQARSVLRREATLEEAMAAAQQGHRNFAKRQQTWFRGAKELAEMHWLEGFGNAPDIVAQAIELVEQHLKL